MSWLSQHAHTLSDYEEDPNPLVCPKCGSREVEYLQDAGAWWHQRPLGEQVIRTKFDVNLYDTILEIECRGCQYREEHPSLGDWG